MSKADLAGVGIHQTFGANAVRPVVTVSLAALLLAGVCFYSAPSFAQASPLSSSGPVVQQGAAAAVPSDLPQLQTASSAGKDDPLAWDSAPAPAAVPAPVAAAPEVPAMPAAKPAPVEKLDVLNKPAADKAADGLEKRVAALEEAVAALKSSATATKDDIESLQVSVGALQQKAADGKVADAQPAPAASPSDEEKPQKAKPARTRKAKKRHSAAAAPSWILKGAKPGTAWVSQKGSSNLRTVVVGDTLSGVGKIRSISKDSLGHWTVSGTKGRISQ